jgi:hypothetical protein
MKNKVYFWMSMLLSIALFSCDNSEELVEPVKQDVKTDDRSDDHKAYDNPHAEDEYLNARTYGECLSGIARK